MMNLDELVDTLETKTMETVEIDVSKFWGKPAKTIFFTLQEPDLAKMGQAPLDGKRVRAENLNWSETTCENIALLALCHVAPASSKPVGLQYVEIAHKDEKCLLRILKQFKAAFPHLNDTEKEIESEKND